jgi:7-cyano-7-deazaguanine synthase
LTDENIEISEADLTSTEIPTSYVPFRNANMLAIATSWAEVLEVNSIYVGAVAEDSSGYPIADRNFTALLNEQSKRERKPETHIKIKTPIIDLSKAEIVRKGN